MTSASPRAGSRCTATITRQPTIGRLPAACLAACLAACSPAPMPDTTPQNGSGAAATASATAATTEAPATSTATASETLSTAAPATSSAPAASTPAEGPVPDASCASCVDAQVRFGPVGGKVPHRTHSTVDPCRIYRRARTSAHADGAPPISCSDSLSCDGSDTGAGKLRDLMKRPDVQKALTSPMTVYGCDHRPVDGTLFSVQVSDGRSFGVGGECAPTCSTKPGKCVPPPAGVKELVSYLKTLDETMLARDPCKSALGPG